MRLNVLFLGLIFCWFCYSCEPLAMDIWYGNGVVEYKIINKTTDTLYYMMYRRAKGPDNQLVYQECTHDSRISDNHESFNLISDCNCLQTLYPSETLHGWFKYAAHGETWNDYFWKLDIDTVYLYISKIPSERYGEKLPLPDSESALRVYRICKDTYDLNRESLTFIYP